MAAPLSIGLSGPLPDTLPAPESLPVRELRVVVERGKTIITRICEGGVSIIETIAHDSLGVSRAWKIETQPGSLA